MLSPISVFLFCDSAKEALQESQFKINLNGSTLTSLPPTFSSIFHKLRAVKGQYLQSMEWK